MKTRLTLKVLNPKTLGAKVLGITLLSLLLASCGDNTETTSQKTEVNTASSVNPKTSTVCEVLTDSYIQSTFAGATEIKKMDMSSLPEGYGYRERFCGYTFTLDSLEYDLQLTLESSHSGNPQESALEATFTQQVDIYKSNDNVESIDDVGDKAYYFKKIKNLITKGAGSVLRVQMSFNSNDDEKVKNMTITVAKDMLVALSKSR